MLEKVGGIHYPPVIFFNSWGKIIYLAPFISLYSLFYIYFLIYKGFPDSVFHLQNAKLYSDK